MVPLIAGERVRPTLVSPALCGVFFTVKTPFARFADPSASLNITFSAVPSNAAPNTVGRTPSTLWPVSAASAACSSCAAVAGFPAASAIAPPFSDSAFAPTDMPSPSASSSITV